MRIITLCTFILSLCLTTLDAKVQFSLSSPQKEIALNEKSPLKQDSQAVASKKASSTIIINLKEVFLASPIIYTVLIVMSFAALSLWLFTLLTFRPKEILSKNIIEDLQHRLMHADFDETFNYCTKKETLFPQVIASGLKCRHLGPQYMVDAMKSEGRRSTAFIWQRITLLDDIVMVSPLLGLLGTIVGMFYAFYDINRSVESLTALFDGLGVAIGTTVVGLLVAILAMSFSSILKYRTIKILNKVEIEAVALANIIQNRM